MHALFATALLSALDRLARGATFSSILYFAAACNCSPIASAMRRAFCCSFACVLRLSVYIFQDVEWSCVAHAMLLNTAKNHYIGMSGGQQSEIAGQKTHLLFGHMHLRSSSILPVFFYRYSRDDANFEIS